MISQLGPAIAASIEASTKLSEMKTLRRSEIIEQTPEADRWRVRALWEAVDSMPTCDHRTTYSFNSGYNHRSDDGILGLGLFGIL